MKKVFLGRAVSFLALLPLTAIVVVSCVFLYIADTTKFHTTYAWASFGGALLGIVLHCLLFLRSEKLKPRILALVLLVLLCGFFVLTVENAIGLTDYCMPIYNTDGDFQGHFNNVTLEKCLAVNVLCGILSTFGYCLCFIRHILQLIVTAAKPRIKRSKKKVEMRAREKAYAKIAKFHEYYEKGIISEEEYKDACCCILRNGEKE